MMALAFIAFTSCSDDKDVDLSNRRFVRIDQPSVYLTVGEKIKAVSYTHLTLPTICSV